MDFIFVNAKYDKQIELSSDLVKYCKKFKKIAVYSSVQFSEQTENAVKQLDKAGIKVALSQPDRTATKNQLLGCDSDWKNLNLKEDVDAFLYVGDGMFHPQALVLAQRDREKFKEVIAYDPISEKYNVLTIKDAEKSIKRYKGSMLRFLSSDVIGVLVSTKSGQQQYKASKELEKKYPDKQFYWFVDNNIEFSQLENFPFIKCWINSACPRISFETERMPMINLSDALENR